MHWTADVRSTPSRDSEGLCSIHQMRMANEPNIKMRLFSWLVQGLGCALISHLPKSGDLGGISLKRIFYCNGGESPMSPEIQLFMFWSNKQNP